MPNLQSNSYDPKLILSGVSPGELRISQRQEHTRLDLEQRIAKLEEQRSKDHLLEKKLHISKSSRSSIQKKRALNRRGELEQLRDKLDREVERPLDRQKKYDFYLAMDSLLENAKDISISTADVPLEDILALYKAPLQALHEKPLNYAYNAGPMLRQILYKFSTNLGSAWPLTKCFYNLSDGFTGKNLPKNTHIFLQQSLRDPDFFHFILHSGGRLKEAFAPDRMLAKLFKHQVEDYLRGDIFLTEMHQSTRAAKQKATADRDALRVIKKKVSQSQIDQCAPEDMSQEQKLLLEQVMKADAAYQLSKDQFDRQRSSYNQVRGILKEINANGHDRSATVEAIYQLWYDVLSSLAALSERFPEKQVEVANKLAELGYQKDLTTTSGLGVFMDLLDSLRSVHLEESARGKTSVLVPTQESQGLFAGWFYATNEPKPLTDFPDVQRSVQGLHRCLDTQLENYVDIALAVGGQHVQIDVVNLSVFKPFLVDTLRAATGPGKLPDFTLVRSLLDALASQDHRALYEQILAFTKRRDMIPVINKHADLLSNEGAKIWLHFANETAGFGFDQKTVKEFQPVLKLLLEIQTTSSPKKDGPFDDVAQVVDCIIRMVMASPAKQPSVMDLLDEIFRMLQRSELLRKRLVETPELRLGLLRFFKVLFRNNLLIPFKHGAATDIQRVFRGLRDRRRLANDPLGLKANAYVDNALIARQVRVARGEPADLVLEGSALQQPIAKQQGEPMRSKWWHPLMRGLISMGVYCLQFTHRQPRQLLWVLEALSHPPSYKKSFFSLASWLRYFAGTNDPDAHLLFNRLYKSIDLITQSNPEFYKELVSDRSNRDAIYQLALVFVDSKMDKNCRVATNAVRHIFNSVLDRVVTQPNTYSAVLALLSIWLDDESFERRCQDAKNHPHLIVGRERDVYRSFEQKEKNQDFVKEAPSSEITHWGRQPRIRMHPMDVDQTQSSRRLGRQTRD